MNRRTEARFQAVRHTSITAILLDLSATMLLWSSALADATPPASGAAEAAKLAAGEPLTWAGLGASVTPRCAGDALAVFPDETGRVRLGCALQRLEGEVTREGLWLASPVEGGTPERFRVVADYVGRDGGAMVALPATGMPVCGAAKARFSRCGLVEEYTVSADGIRQDLLVAAAPAGAGALRVDLAVSGAQVQSMPGGAWLVLEKSGRKIAYHRVRVMDATGDDLPARLDVVGAGRLALIAEDSGATYPVRIDPTFSDDNWVSLGGPPGVGPPGTEGAVYAAVVNGAGLLHIGGCFTTAGGVAASRVAKWDGSGWSALGEGLDDTVYALATSGKDLYVGGLFTRAGSVEVNGVAKWDGSRWTALGEGMNSTVYALVVSSSGVYAGGNFSQAGGAEANGVAKWDGGRWSPLGEGVLGEGVRTGTVYALTLLGDDLYVGGDFEWAGDRRAANVARWDGGGWWPLHGGVAHGGVRALTVWESAVYVAGNFERAGGLTANSIAKWNGSSWSVLGKGVGHPTQVNAVAVSNGAVYAGGNFDIAGGVAANCLARWDGSRWSALTQGVTPRPFSSVQALVMSGTDLYVGGIDGDARYTDTASADALRVNNVAKWDGGSWSPLGTGLNYKVHALAVSGNDLYVGGWLSGAGLVAANHVAKWDGSRWSALGSGIGGVYNTPVSAMAVSAGELYVGGAFTNAGGFNVNRMARWDGSSWSPLGTGVDSTVAALAVLGRDLYAGGWFTNAGGVPAHRVAKWDGSRWSGLGSGMSGSEGRPRVLALTASGRDLYAGGWFTYAGGVLANHLAKWDGSRWSALGSGTDGEVRALAVAGNDLYAAGDFRTVGGIAARGVARWDGSNWSPVGSEIDGTRVAALAVAGGNVYAAGKLTLTSSADENHIVKWDGSGWSALGSGVKVDSVDSHWAQVSALAISGSDLYAGGWFEIAGGKVSAYVAKAYLGDYLPSRAKAIAVTNGTATVTFGATPGFQYHVERTTNLTAPLNWTTLTAEPLKADAEGWFTVTDPTAPPGTAYYRSRQDN